MDDSNVRVMVNYAPGVAVVSIQRLDKNGNPVGPLWSETVLNNVPICKDIYL